MDSEKFMSFDQLRSLLSDGQDKFLDALSNDFGEIVVDGKSVNEIVDSILRLRDEDDDQGATEILKMLQSDEGEKILYGAMLDDMLVNQVVSSDEHKAFRDEFGLSDEENEQVGNVTENSGHDEPTVSDEASNDAVQTVTHPIANLDEIPDLVTTVSEVSDEDKTTIDTLGYKQATQKRIILESLMLSGDRSLTYDKLLLYMLEIDGNFNIKKLRERIAKIRAEMKATGISITIMDDIKSKTFFLSYTSEPKINVEKAQINGLPDWLPGCIENIEQAEDGWHLKLRGDVVVPRTPEMDKVVGKLLLKLKYGVEL